MTPDPIEILFAAIRRYRRLIRLYPDSGRVLRWDSQMKLARLMLRRAIAERNEKRNDHDETGIRNRPGQNHARD